MRIRLFLAALALMSVSFLAPAAVASGIALGNSCPDLGASAMADDHTAILLCAFPIASAATAAATHCTSELPCVWKPMSGGGGGSSFTKCQVKMNPTPVYPLCPSGWTDVHHYASGQIVAGGGVPAMNGWWVGTAEDGTWFYDSGYWAIATYACTVCNK